MDFDAVKPRSFGAIRREAIVLNDFRNLIGFQSSRNLIRLFLTVGRVDPIAADRDRRGCHWQITIMKIAV